MFAIMKHGTYPTENILSWFIYFMSNIKMWSDMQHYLKARYLSHLKSTLLKKSLYLLQDISFVYPIHICNMRMSAVFKKGAYLNHSIFSLDVAARAETTKCWLQTVTNTKVSLSFQVFFFWEDWILLHFLRMRNNIQNKSSDNKRQNLNMIDRQ